MNKQWKHLNLKFHLLCSRQIIGRLGALIISPAVTFPRWIIPGSLEVGDVRWQSSEFSLLGSVPSLEESVVPLVRLLMWVNVFLEGNNSNKSLTVVTHERMEQHALTQSAPLPTAASSH